MGDENDWVIGSLSIVITVIVATTIKIASWLKVKRRPEDRGIDRKDSLG